MRRKVDVIKMQKHQSPAHKDPPGPNDETMREGSQHQGPRDRVQASKEKQSGPQGKEQNSFRHLNSKAGRQVTVEQTRRKITFNP